MTTKKISVKLSETDYKKLCQLASFDTMTPDEWLSKYLSAVIPEKHLTLMKHLSKIH